MPPEGDQRRRILQEALDEGFLTLGESGMKAIYFHVENVTSIKRENLPDHLEALQTGLEKIFGEGAKMIEAAIVKSLCRKLGVQPQEGKERGFVEKLNDAFECLATGA